MLKKSYSKGFLKFVGALVIAGTSIAASANVITYQYEAQITQANWSIFYIQNNREYGLASGPSAFGTLDPSHHISGLNVGDTFSGTLSYDTSASPTGQVGFWSQTYGGGGFTAGLGTMSPAATTSFQYQSNQLALANGSVTVTNGPAFPIVQQDSFGLNGKNVTSFGARVNTETFAISFNPVGSTGPFASTALPASLSLATLPYSGGYIDRSSVCNGCGTSGRESISFQFTSLNIAPVPEPETYAMMLAGLGLLGVAARRRKQNSVA